MGTLRSRTEQPATSNGLLTPRRARRGKVTVEFHIGLPGRQFLRIAIRAGAGVGPGVLVSRSRDTFLGRYAVRWMELVFCGWL